MVISEIYNFQLNQYDKEGVNTETGVYFMLQIKEWEIDFHKKHPLYFANTLTANTSFMILLNHCLDLGTHEQCGMDLIDGEIDLDANLEMESHSDVQTIYAIGSEIEENSEEPILLVVNDSLPDGTVVLEYSPDDDGDRIVEPIPVVSDTVRSRKIYV